MISVAFVRAARAAEAVPVSVCAVWVCAGAVTDTDREDDGDDDGDDGRLGAIFAGIGGRGGNGASGAGTTFVTTSVGDDARAGCTARIRPEYMPHWPASVWGET